MGSDSLDPAGGNPPPISRGSESLDPRGRSPSEISRGSESLDRPSEGDSARISSDSAPLDLEGLIKAQAYGLGFDLVGIATLGPVERASVLDEWLASGYAGEMGYIERGAEKRRDTRLPFEGARSAVVVGMNYGGREPDGPVARYARGDDYHDVLIEKLRELHRRIDEAAGRNVPGKAYVDTGPILERELARRAGLGWFGKHTNLVNPRKGSFFFIGSLLLDLALEPDAPFEADRCGTCTRCLDACPTDAFTAPRVLDARRCISYLTIESRSEIPEEFHEGIGEHLYGCDVCQEVCPWNVRFAPELPADSPFQAREFIAGKSTAALARDILALEAPEFSAVFRRSPMKRAKLRGLQRNAAVVLQQLDRQPVTHRPEAAVLLENANRQSSGESASQ